MSREEDRKSLTNGGNEEEVVAINMLNGNGSGAREGRRRRTPGKSRTYIRWRH